jgi:myo-inositol-1(or 4)-monophosphatase
MTSKRLELAKSTAVSVGKYLLKHFNGSGNRAEMKPDRTLVTKADLEADFLIQEEIKGEYPADGILSEEGNTTYPNKENVWILDPLDGTVNFSLGLHYWGVSIAHLRDGYPQNAVVYFPVIDELYSASAGKGAELNSQPLRISDPRVHSPYPIFIHCSRMHDHYRTTLPFKRRSLGAATYSMCLVAKGIAILTFESTPKIWDFAASWLIVEEAGGIIQSLDGQHPFPAQPGTNYHGHAVTLIGAANEDIMNEAITGIVRR